MTEICSNEECTSCGVCVSICPNQCIELKNNKYGHLIPFVNNELCINCELCRRSCHNNKQIKLHSPIRCYAMRYGGIHSENSTSGAISYLLSKHVLTNNGIVYGASFVNGTVSHIRIDKIDNIYKIQGSKYVQSLIDVSIYQSLKEDAIAGKTVLYTGTGCQIAAAKSFLKKDYSNVVYLEILCHGTPSSSYLADYRKQYSSINPDDVKFRKKGQYVLEFYKKNKLLFSQNIRNSMYLQGFLHDIILHSSCYNCKYCGEYRIGDITIGDYWGKFLAGHECSAVLVCTNKGGLLIEKILISTVYQDADFYNIAMFNKPLCISAKQNVLSRLFLFLYPICGFSIALNLSTFLHRIKNLLLILLNK